MKPRTHTYKLSKYELEDYNSGNFRAILRPVTTKTPVSIGDFVKVNNCKHRVTLVVTQHLKSFTAAEFAAAGFDPALAIADGYEMVELDWDGPSVPWVKRKHRFSVTAASNPLTQLIFLRKVTHG